MGHINNIKVPFSIDVGIGDVIVPNVLYASESLQTFPL